MICIPAKLFSQSSHISPDQAEMSTWEIEKHMIYAFSVLELLLETAGHIFGAFVFHIIGINQIRSAMQSLKIVLQKSTVIFCPEYIYISIIHFSQQFTYNL